MTARMNYLNAPKDVTKAMTDLQAHVTNSGLEPTLLEPGLSAGVAHQRMRLLH